MKTQQLSKQAYCFVESFDSVRYTRLSNQSTYEALVGAERKTKEAQAEIELIYALLLGQKIVVPEAHSFDSVGFLSVVTKALEARPTKGLSKDWIREPFVLSKRAAYTSYLDMVSQRLSQPSFILSALSEINANTALRSALSAQISTGDFSRGFQLLQGEVSGEVQASCEQKLDNIRRINNYFADVPSKEALNLGRELEKYVRNLITLNNIPAFLQQESGFQQLRDSLTAIEQAGIKFYDRSTVRDRGKQYLDTEEYLGIVEYVDSCYNAVIYKATGADTGILTTTEQGRYVDLAQVLSEESASLGPRDRIEVRFNDGDDTAYKQLLESWHGKRNDRWQSVWEIMLNDSWIKSVNELMQAPEDLKRDAYKAHMRELQKLTSEYSSDITVDETAEFSQSLHAIADREDVVVFEQSFEDLAAEDTESSTNITSVNGSTPGMDL